MPSYIALVDFTEQGMRNIKDSPARAEQFAEKARAFGATVKDAYWTTGAHDGVLIIEAPDDQSASALFLSLSQAGNVRTQTLSAYDRREMQSIIGKLG